MLVFRLKRKVWVELAQFHIRNNQTDVLPCPKHIDLPDDVYSYLTSLSDEELIRKATDPAHRVFSEDEEQIENTKDFTTSVFNYKFWNQLLLDVMFPAGEDIDSASEIPCFIVDDDLFNICSKGLSSFDGFSKALNNNLGSSSFVESLKIKIEEYKVIDIDGKKCYPKNISFFGYILLLIYMLSEAKGEFNSNNVYDRINTYGKYLFRDKWGRGVDSQYSKKVLELGWENISKWSKKRYKGDGGFNLRDPKSSNKKYVSRLQRHALLKKRDYEDLCYLVNKNGFVVDEEITLKEWVAILEDGKNKLRNANSLIEYLMDDSAFSTVLLNYLNGILEANFRSFLDNRDNQQTSSTSNVRRLLVSFSKLPEIRRNPIQLMFRTEIEEEGLDRIEEINICHQGGGFSEGFNLPVNTVIDDFLLIEGENYRYKLSSGPKVLIRVHELGFFIEVPLVRVYNSEELLVLFQSENDFEGLSLSESINVKKYKTTEGQPLCKFKNLTSEDFKVIYKYLGSKRIFDETLITISPFGVGGNKIFPLEFDHLFQYKGAENEVEVKYISEQQNLNLKKSLDNKEIVKGPVYRLSFESKSEEEGVLELSSNKSFTKKIEVKSIWNISSNNIGSPLIRDENDIPLNRDDSTKGFLYNIPYPILKSEDDRVKLQEWMRENIKIFKSKKPRYNYSEGDSVEFDYQCFENCLLKFLSSKAVTKYQLEQIVAGRLQMIHSVDKQKALHWAKPKIRLWKDLGYIDYGIKAQDKVYVCETTMVFLAAEKGVKAAIIGYRDRAVVDAIVKYGKKNDIEIICAQDEENLLPQKIMLYDPKGKDVEKFQKLATVVLKVSFFNNIGWSHPEKYPYQLGCLYKQERVVDFKSSLQDRPNYQFKHLNMQVFDIENDLKWEVFSEDVESLPINSIIKYPGSEGVRTKYVIMRKCEEEKKMVSKVLENPQMAIYMQRSNLMLSVDENPHRENSTYTLLVLNEIKLPYWISRGLVLTTFSSPKYVSCEGKFYQAYYGVPKGVKNIVENKLGQDIRMINKEELKAI